MEEGDAGLQFKSFLGTTPAVNGNTGTQPRNAGYFQDAPQTRGGFWTVEYYQKYFDIDTKAVIARCYTTLLPMSSDYLTSHTTPTPDLYGPFWTLTTLIFCLFVFTSFTASLVNWLSSSSEIYEYNFTNLSVAVTLVYAYGIGLPALLWITLRYMGVGNEDWSLIEAIATWGYGMFVWIPISLLCIIPVAIARFVFVGIGFGMSGWFLWSNIYPIITSATHKSARLLIPVLIVLHAGVALTFKVLFFSYYILEGLGPEDPIPGAEQPVETAVARILRL